MASSQPTPSAWRREAPRDDSPDGRSEISLDETVPTPAWKRKPKAWLNRTNLLTALIVFVLSIFFLVAALWPARHAVKKGMRFYCCDQPIGGSTRYIMANLTSTHRSQYDYSKPPILP
jgi:hypothetical protein